MAGRSTETDTAENRDAGNAGMAVTNVAAPTPPDVNVSSELKIPPEVLSAIQALLKQANTSASDPGDIVAQAKEILRQNSLQHVGMQDLIAQLPKEQSELLQAQIGKMDEAQQLNEEALKRQVEEALRQEHEALEQHVTDNPGLADLAKRLLKQEQLTEEQKELERLRKELKDAKLENEILKKAVSIFSGNDRKS